MLALRAGRLPFVQWVLSASALDPELHASAVEHAAVSDLLDLVRWLVEERRCPMPGDALWAAAHNGRLVTLQWLHGKGDGGHLQGAVRFSARGGRLHILEWLIEQGCVLTEDAMQEATEWSTTATVAWLLDRGCPFVEEALVLRSCSNISGDIFQFLVETKHMQYDPHVCKYEAMKHGWFTTQCCGILLAVRAGRCSREILVVSATPWSKRIRSVGRLSAPSSKMRTRPLLVRRKVD